MEIPYNIIHNYIAFPVLLIIGIDALRRNRANHNITASYVGLACIMGAIAAFCFGFPALFTHDARALSIWTFVGDCAYTFAMLLLWLILIRGTLAHKRTLFVAANSLAVILGIVSLVEAVHRNLILSHSAYISSTAGGGIALLYVDSLSFQIINGLNSLALALIGVYFWRQGKGAATKAQRLRIRSLAVGFLFFAAAFVITPIFPVDNQAQISVALLSAGLIIIGFFAVIGAIAGHKETAPN